MTTPQGAMTYMAICDTCGDPNNCVLAKERLAHGCSNCSGDDESCAIKCLRGPGMDSICASCPEGLRALIDKNPFFGVVINNLVDDLAISESVDGFEEYCEGEDDEGWDCDNDPGCALPISADSDDNWDEYLEDEGLICCKTPAGTLVATAYPVISAKNEGVSIGKRGIIVHLERPVQGISSTLAGTPLLSIEFSGNGSETPAIHISIYDKASGALTHKFVIDEDALAQIDTANDRLVEKRNKCPKCGSSVLTYKASVHKCKSDSLGGWITSCSNNECGLNSGFWMSPEESQVVWDEISGKYR